MIPLVVSIVKKLIDIQAVSLTDNGPVIEPTVPLAGHGGQPRTADMREVINAIPRSTVKCNTSKSWE